MDIALDGNVTVKPHVGSGAAQLTQSCGVQLTNKTISIVKN